MQKTTKEVSLDGYLYTIYQEKAENGFLKHYIIVEKIDPLVGDHTDLGYVVIPTRVDNGHENS